MHNDYSMAKDGMQPHKSGKPKTKRKKVLREIRHRATKNGFLVEHHFHGGYPGGNAMEEHSVADKEALMAHMAEHQPELQGEEHSDPNEAAESQAGMA